MLYKKCMPCKGIARKNIYGVTGRDLADIRQTAESSLAEGIMSHSVTNCKD